MKDSRFIKVDSSSKRNKQKRLREFLSSKYEFRFNEIRLCIEFRYKDTPNMSFKRVNESTLYDEVNYLFGTVSNTQLLLTIHSENVAYYYNPLKDWFKSLESISDNEDPFKEFTDFIVLNNNSLEQRNRLYTGIKKWFVGAIKTLFDKKYVHKQSLIFQGAQGIGKTPFCRSFLPSELQEYLKADQYLDMTSKDGQRALISNFVIIIDEIDNFLESKRNQNAYKSYMSQKYSNFRLQWGKVDVIKQRISNFLGTFNGSEFIKDETGSSRFTIFSVKYFRNEGFLGQGNKDIELFDVVRCWRKAYQLFKNGYNPEYTTKEKEFNEESNGLFKYNTPEFESILNFIEKSNCNDLKAQFQTTTEICAELNRIQSSFIFKKNNIGKALTRLQFKRTCKKINKVSKYGYFIKYKSL